MGLNDHKNAASPIGIEADKHILSSNSRCPVSGAQFKARLSRSTVSRITEKL
jgi:hypothetical protein